MKKIETIQIGEANYPSRILLFWLFEIYFMTIARFILNKFGLSEGLCRNITLVLVASVPLLYLGMHIRQLKKAQYLPGILLIFLMFLLFGFTLLIHPEYEDFFTRSGYGIERVLRPECAMYAFLFFSLIDNPDELLEVVRKYAIFYFLYIFIFQLMPRLINGYFEDISSLGNEVHRPYSLTFGYSMLFPAVVFLYIFFIKNKVFYLLGAIISTALIFLYGNRGALLMIVIFVGLMVISNILDSKNVAYKTAKIMAVILLIIIVIIFGRMLLQSAVSVLQSLGIQSRTLEMLAEGSIMDDTGRDMIWKPVIEAIKVGGVWGYGVFGDRPIVSPVHYAGYSHNIFLELLVSFGAFGILIILGICACTFWMIFKCKDSRWRGLFIIFFSISCQLFMSMSFWYVMEFWAAAAIAYKYLYLQKLKRKSKLQLKG